MCGVAGFVGMGHLQAEQRFDLVEALGIGIDSRGGDAAGFVSVSGGPRFPVVRLARKLDEWSDARGRFVRAAALGHSVMMHSRWTTSGNAKDIECAHPFPIRRSRNGTEKTVLYGAHNGMLEGTVKTAKSFGRSHTVDSREFLELLADKQYDIIRELDGYGVVTYVKPTDGIIRVVRISHNSDFEIVQCVGGGMVYASTKAILKDALDFAGLTVERELAVRQVGQVYRLEPSRKPQETSLRNVRVSESWGNWGGYCGTPSSSAMARVQSSQARYYGQYEQKDFDSRFNEKDPDKENWGLEYVKRWDDALRRFKWVKVNKETGEVIPEPSFLDPEPPSGSVEPESSGILTPPDFDEEQAEQWEEFWKANAHLLNDRSEK